MVVVADPHGLHRRVSRWAPGDGVPVSVRIVLGDCRDVLRTLDAESVDAVVTDPPYDLTDCHTGGAAIPGKFGQRTEEQKAHRVETRKRGGFMGKTWDGTGVAFDPETWIAVARVLNPGGHLLAFGGPRTFHRMTCAIEDAGFEIRDVLCYLYGSGFPKSSRVNRDPRFCQCGEAARSDASNSREPSRDDHSDRAAALPDGDPLREDAVRLTNRLSGSPDDYLPVDDFDDAHALREAGGVPAFSQQPGYVQAHTHFGVRADDQGDEPLRNPSLAQCSDRPSSPDCFDPSPSLSVEQSDTRESKSASVNTPTLTDNDIQVDRTQRTALQSSASSTSTENYSSGFPRCLICGKPNVDGFGTALKPSWEPIILARKPLIGTVAENWIAHGTGALNIDGCRIEASAEYGRSAARADGTTNKGEFFSGENGGIKSGELPDYASALGRWPANVCLDEAAAAMLDAAVGNRKAGGAKSGNSAHAAAYSGNLYGDAAKHGVAWDGFGDKGGPSRFFYTAKSSRAERNRGLEGMPERANRINAPRESEVENFSTSKANHHPTVKPVDLMRWLVRLVTPPHGLVLDPFMGSGTTGIACVFEERSFLGIDRETEYLEIARRRIERAQGPMFAAVEVS